MLAGDEEAALSCAATTAEAGVEADSRNAFMMAWALRLYVARRRRDVAALDLLLAEMLGSVSEVDDAVQEAWLRLSRADAAGIDNLGGWLTTVVARVCLDLLRSRRSRREDAFAPAADAPPPAPMPAAPSSRLSTISPAPPPACSAAPAILSG